MSIVLTPGEETHSDVMRLTHSLSLSSSDVTVHLYFDLTN